MQKREYEKKVACGLCGAKNKQQALPPPRAENVAALQKEWQCQPVRCRGCGLEFYSPRLAERFVMSNFFRSASARSDATSMIETGVYFGDPPAGSAEKQFAALAANHAAIYERLAAQFEKLNRRAPQALFEVGAGVGWFLAKARELAAAKGAKLDVAGTEPNIYSAEHARMALKIEVAGGSFGDYKPSGRQKGRYDLLLDGLLAASYAPVKDLKKLAVMARSGAIIAIRTFVTDNDPDGKYVHPVFNQTHFSIKTLKGAVEKAGLRIVELDDRSEAAHSQVTVFATNARR